MRRLMRDSDTLHRELVEGLKLYPKDRDECTSVFLNPDRARPLFHIHAESQELDLAQRLAEEYESKILKWIEQE